MSGPTPGPWRALIGKTYIRVYTDPDKVPPNVGNVQIAHIAGPEDDGVRRWNADRWAADARLIAAAPDLLEALREICSAISKARDLVPDEEEGLASSIFAWHLNMAQTKAERVIWTAIGKEGEWCETQK